MLSVERHPLFPGMKKVLSSVSLALDGLAGDRFLLALLDDLGSIPACPRSSGSGSLLSSCLLLLFSLGQSKMSDQHPSILILERKNKRMITIVISWKTLSAFVVCPNKCT